MGRRKGQDAGLLRRLVPETDNLTIGPGGRIVAKELHEVPINEFKLPQRRLLIERAIGACGNKLAWQGNLDVHHIGWSYADYRALSTDEFESVGESYRDTGAVKIRVPRQLHEYFHVGFAKPPIPDEDVMEQFLAEDVQIRKLLRTLLPSIEEQRRKTIDTYRDLTRHAHYLEALSSMPTSEVGHLPGTESLARLTADEARATLRERISILRYAGGEF